MKERIKIFLKWASFAFLIALVLIGLVILIVIISTQAESFIQNMLKNNLITEFVESESEFRTSEKVDIPEYGEDEDDTVQQGSQIKNNIRKEGRLISSSFTDLFSGVGWINKEVTTMYHDSVVSAFMFPPSFEWRKISDKTVDGNKFIDKKNGLDARCLGEKCLVQDDVSIYLVSKSSVDNYKSSGHKIVFPSEIKKDNLVDVSIGVLDTTWLIGIVENRGGEYIGNVFYYKNEEFKEVFNRDGPFRSRYAGSVGFGGSDNNFLVVFGAYEGQAYYIQNGEAYDISKFFGIRVMNNGFHPVVLQGSPNGNNETTWYVYSVTEGNPKLLKLFQNGTDHIVGAIDLSRSLFTGGLKKALFYFDEVSNVLKTKLIKPSGTAEYWEFKDLGFDKNDKQIVASVNINNYPAKIRQASISRIDYNVAGANCNFYLSNGNDNWYEVKLGEEITFPEGRIHQLKWKVDLTPTGSKYHSPFLDTIRLNYLVEFL